MDARIAELVARLTALERERAEIVAEIDSTIGAEWEDRGYQSGPLGKSQRSHRPEFDNRKEDCSVSPAFPWPLRCLPSPLGESYDGTQRLRTRLRERMAAWDLRKTKSEMFGMSESGIPGRQ